MKEVPILFSGSMVRAILEGRKTQTRRVIKPQPRLGWDYRLTAEFKAVQVSTTGVRDRVFIKCPYGQPGDRLWIIQGASFTKSIPKEERFWSRVYKFESCWEWFGKTNRKGYGTIRWDGMEIAAHRASWLLHGGSIPKGQHVLHTCDLPWCVNPGHLYLGTNDDNIRDKVKRGRSAEVCGEDNGSAGLTRAQVDEIRSLYWEQDIYQRDIADQFSISQSQVSRIVNSKRWLKESWFPSVGGHRRLEITGIRVERVQEIGEQDAYAEGFNKDGCNLGPEGSAPAAFRHFWDSINEKRGFGWGLNPFVWVLYFRKLL
jgi:hypothetical protein